MSSVEDNLPERRRKDDEILSILEELGDGSVGRCLARLVRRIQLRKRVDGESGTGIVAVRLFSEAKDYHWSYA
jgi:hypothetical protein